MPLRTRHVRQTPQSNTNRLLRHTLYILVRPRTVIVVLNLEAHVFQHDLVIRPALNQLAGINTEILRGKLDRVKGKIQSVLRVVTHVKNPFTRRAKSIPHGWYTETHGNLFCRRCPYPPERFPCRKRGQLLPNIPHRLPSQRGHCPLSLEDLDNWCLEVGVLDALDAWTENLIPDEFYSESAEGYTTVGIDEYADRVESHLQGKGLDVQVTGTAMSDSNAFNSESILSVYPNQQFSPSDSLQRAVDEFVLPVTEALTPILDWDSTDYVWK